MAAYTLLPSFLIATLFGGPVSGIRLMTRSVRASITSSVTERLVRGIEPAAIRRGGDPVDHFFVGNLRDDLVGRRIDQVDAVSGGIGLDDEGLAGLARTDGVEATRRRRPSPTSVA